jgi:hypothetical protein
MSNQDAVCDAHQRIAALQLPDGLLTGYTVTLPVYEDEAAFRLSAGRGALQFNHMVNTAMFRILKKRKATVIRRVLTVADFVAHTP